MDELRLVRREEQSLVVATEAGEEFRLVVDDSVLAELRHLSRRERSTSKIRPREIQSLIRAGKSRAEVMELTGLDESDIERYEEPVVAERRYILELAHGVPVRTSGADESQQRFGTVMAERLAGLSAENSAWDSWRDEETGWLISLDFTSHTVEHHAVWSFDHRKSVLEPLNPEAVTLSKQGDVGNRLIPKLRAVDAAADGERFAPEAFDASSAEAADSSTTTSPAGSDTNDTAEPDPGEEYARRREIDQRAISTTEADADADFGQTADLLDALRRRRGEREQGQLDLGLDSADTNTEVSSAEDSDTEDVTSTGSGLRAFTPRETDSDTPSTAAEPSGTTSPYAPTAADAPASDRTQASSSEQSDATASGERSVSDAPAQGTEKSGRSRRRASIPSWDDILFGTRSDDDPA